MYPRGKDAWIVDSAAVVKMPWIIREPETYGQDRMGGRELINGNLRLDRACTGKR